MNLKGVSLPAVAIGGGGLLFLWSGLHGASVTASLRDLVGGHQPSGALVNPIAAGVPGGGSGGGSVSPVGNITGVNQANRSLGRLMAAARGWTGNEWNALDQLWTGESRWQNTIANPSSGAYGIPQALPGAKMGPAANPPVSSAAAQIRWGLAYIADRYKTPAAAWQHELAVGWY